MRRCLSVALGVTLAAASLLSSTAVVGSGPAAATAPQPGEIAVFPTDVDVTGLFHGTNGADGGFWAIGLDQSLVRVVPGRIFEDHRVVGASRYSHLTAGSDGNLWLTGYGQAIRVTPAGTATTFSHGLGHAPGDIASGPDGNLWLLVGSHVVRMTTAGLATDVYQSPSATARSITTGPDGALWVTYADDTVTRLTTAGDATSFPTTGLSAPDQIVTGADGNLWVAGSGGSVARITPDGVVSVFATGQSALRDLAIGPQGEVLALGSQAVVAIAADGTSVTTSTSDFVNPTSLVTRPDGEVWLTQESSWTNEVLRMLPDGTVEHATAGVSAPRAVTLGPDGEVWIAGFMGSSLGRVAVDGTVEPVHFPAGQGIGYGMAVGPDGNLWVPQLDPRTPRLWRITPEREAVPVATPGILATDVVTGPDGNLWLAGSDHDPWLVGRLTMEGALTLFPVPGMTNLARVIAGPDGNIWIVGVNGTLGRMTTDGELTVFTVDGQPSFGDGAVGSDGNLWVTGSFAVVRVTPEGESTVFPTGIGASVIASGPDGNLWVTGRDVIGRITPDGAVTRFPAAGMGRPHRLVADAHGYLWAPTGNGFPSTITRIAAAAVDVELSIDETEVTVGDPVHAHVTVSNTGPTDLTGMRLASEQLDACAGPTPALAPGEQHTLDCTSTVTGEQLGSVGMTVDVDTDQTQPKTTDPTMVTVHGGIIGTVTDDETGLPIPGAWVIALDEATSMPAASTAADAEGRYELPVVPGTYRLEFWDPTGAHAFEWYATMNPPEDWDDLIPVDVESTATTTVDNALSALDPPADASEPGGIRGTVVDRDTGGPIAGAWVVAVRGGIPIRGLITDQNGGYSFDGLEGVPHILVALDPTGAHRHDYFDGHLTPGDPLDLVTPTSPLPATADFRLAPR